MALWLTKGPIDSAAGVTREQDHAPLAQGQHPRASTPGATVALRPRAARRRGG
jgi:hypothetical protein